MADAGTTTFVLNAGGEEKVVSVYGLFEMPDPNVPDPVDRAGFAQLQTLLLNFEQQVEDGVVTDVEPYEPELYRVVMIDGMGEPTSRADRLAMGRPDDGRLPGRRRAGRDRHPRRRARRRAGGHSERRQAWAFGSRLLTASSSQFAIRPLLPDEAAAAEL